jgi:hypothetical protein
VSSTSVRAEGAHTAQGLRWEPDLRFFSAVDDYSSASLACKASFLGHAIDFLMNYCVTILRVPTLVLLEMVVQYRENLARETWPP